MLKINEIRDTNSCWNKAKMGQRVFIILDHDKAAPDTIRHWVTIRLKKRLNKVGDAQIEEALVLADSIEKEIRLKEVEEAKNNDSAA